MSMSMPSGAYELLEAVEEQPLTVPDELTTYLMRKSGVDPKDPKLVKLVSLAAQRFIAATVHDSIQLCKARLSSTTKRQLKVSGYKDRLVLTTEDLSRGLRECGVNETGSPWQARAVISGT
eukprot:gene15521-21609_t